VGGYGEEELIGMRFPAGTGVAGWVLATRTPLILDDVQNDPRFAADFAKGTGYVPQGLMAVPLLHEERALGVLEVLDRPQQSRFSLEEMELLGLFANQSAIALDLMQRAREAEAVLNESESDLAVVADLAARIDTLEGARREAGIELMRTLTAML
jgi:GAF domain-containing protein